MTTDWTRPTGLKRAPRDLWQALRRGLGGRCPNCGRGAMFRAFLQVADHCPACGEALHHQRADDAPAYFVILILGHLLVPTALAVEIAFAPPYWVHALLWGPLTIAAALLMLPMAKGALVAWQWANYMHGFDPDGADDLVPRHAASGCRADAVTDITERLADPERARTATKRIRPRDAATLILIDRSGPAPKVLMGRRHASHAFMPSKFVFPGGRVESYDGRMAAHGELAEDHRTRLLKNVVRGVPARTRAFALAAIRETCEETGLMLGRPVDHPPKAPSPAWQAFTDAKVLPDLTRLHFIARAITPPPRNRRFDARFFAADADGIAHRIEGVVGPDAELDEIVWVPIAQARELDLPTITRVVLEELENRIAGGFDPALPVPFFRMLNRRFVRALL